MFSRPLSCLDIFLKTKDQCVKKMLEVVALASFFAVDLLVRWKEGGTI